MEKETKKPIYKERAGRFDVAIWLNEDEKGIARKSVTFRKSWTKDGKEWDEAKISVFPREIPDAILVLQEALKAVRLGSQKEEPAE